MHISFSFIPIALYAAIYGPLKGGILAGLASMLGCLFFNPSLFFPGFDLSNFLAGFIYGFFLHKKPLSLWRVCLPFIFVNLIVNLGFNTLWLAMLYGKAFWLLFSARVFKEFLSMPINIFIFYTIYRSLATFLSKHFQMTYLLKNN